MQICTAKTDIALTDMGAAAKRFHYNDKITLPNNFLQLCREGKGTSIQRLKSYPVPDADTYSTTQCGVHTLILEYVVRVPMSSADP